MLEFESYLLTFAQQMNPRPGHRPEGLVVGRPEMGGNTLAGRFIIQANINRLEIAVSLNPLCLSLCCLPRRMNMCVSNLSRLPMRCSMRNESLSCIVVAVMSLLFSKSRPIRNGTLGAWIPETGVSGPTGNSGSGPQLG